MAGWLPGQTDLMANENLFCTETVNENSKYVRYASSEEKPGVITTYN